MDTLIYIYLSVYTYIFMVTWLSAFWILDELAEGSIKVIASVIFAIIWPISIPAFFISNLYKK